MAGSVAAEAAAVASLVGNLFAPLSPPPPSIAFLVDLIPRVVSLGISAPRSAITPPGVIVAIAGKAPVCGRQHTAFSLAHSLRSPDPFNPAPSLQPSVRGADRVR